MEKRSNRQKLSGEQIPGHVKIATLSFAKPWGPPVRIVRIHGPKFNSEFFIEKWQNQKGPSIRGCRC